MTVWVGSSVKRKKCLKLRFFVLVYYKERKNQISEEKKYYNTEMIKKHSCTLLELWINCNR